MGTPWTARPGQPWLPANGCPVTIELGDDVSVVAVADLATISVSGADALGRTLPVMSGVNLARIVWSPPVSALVVSVAWPVGLSGAAPRTTAPSLKTTTPVAVPVLGARVVTVAVKVTGRPNVGAFGAAVITVEVGASAMICASVPMLGFAFASPVYCAVIVWFPAVSALVVTVACAVALSVAGGPSGAAPSTMNTTVPVGVFVPGATVLTVAVNVTACPKIGSGTDAAMVVVLSALLMISVSWLEVLAPLDVSAVLAVIV